ncbi:MAG TPA: PilT/PilU family type 4a pilus ATPase [Burkholderiales bacterium]|nr:PilT/PilU family type 4a pilus ATPase [Burkholderiales bacterium]
MFVRSLFKLMADTKASDMFFTAGSPVQIKIKGDVVPVDGNLLDSAATKRICYEAMNEEQVAHFEKEMEINFSLVEPGVGSFRVNVFRQRGACAMVIRHIKHGIPTIEELQLPPKLTELVVEKRGLILVVGSTGSGKSSTLAAMINHRNQTQSGHILTIEDPIEFMYRHGKSIVNQREVGIDTRSYHNALINAMREAPDVILIGESRDRETFGAALQYAQTGHLCLTTVHANNSYYGLNRVINMYPHDARESLQMDLSVSLKAVISQRLVHDVNGEILPAVELMINTKHIQELIKNGDIDQIKDAMEKSLAPGSQTFEQSLFKLYQEGRITLEEAMANSDSPTNLHWLINNAAKAPARPAPAPAGAPAAAPQAPAAPAPAAQDDFSGIKLNLDALG